MVLDKKIIKTWNRLDEVANFYFKGFGNIIAGINAWVFNFKDGIYDKEKANTAYEGFNKIWEFYLNIPFNELNGKNDFYPLFVVDSLLKKYKFSLDKVLIEGDFHYVYDVKRIGSTIVEVGRLYEDNFQSLLKDIRKNSSFKDFKLKILDYRGLEWDF